MVSTKKHGMATRVDTFELIDFPPEVLIFSSTSGGRDLRGFLTRLPWGLGKGSLRLAQNGLNSS